MKTIYGSLIIRPKQIVKVEYVELTRRQKLQAAIFDSELLQFLTIWIFMPIVELTVISIVIATFLSLVQK